MTFLVVLAALCVCLGIGAVAFRCLGPLRRDAASTGPSVAVIVPCKGADADTDAFIATLLAQSYAPYRVIWCIEEGDDAAEAAFRRSGLGASGELKVAPAATQCSQKNANLLAGIAALTPQDRIIVFADADTRLPESWLGKIVAQLESGEADVVSGYRLQVPVTASLPVAVVTACEWGLAGFARLRPVSNWFNSIPRHVWGGTVAIRRESWDAIEPLEQLATSYNDDVMLSYVFHAADLRVLIARDLLLPSPINGTFRQLIHFGRRQHFAVRFYSPFLYRLGITVLTISSFLWLAASATASAGIPGGAAMLLVLFAGSAIKTALRLRHFRRVAGDDWRAEPLVVVLMVLAEGPLALFHLAVALSVLRADRIRWGGKLYLVEAPFKVTVVADA